MRTTPRGVRVVLAAVTACVAMSAQAMPDADARIEQGVQRLAEQLRCLVCQNQTLADSHAPLAVDLKNQVREQLRAGRADEEVIAYMTQRYGDFVLYRPPFKATTALLWLGPALLAAMGVAVGWRAVRRQARVHSGDGGA
ncbi:MAG TPA: cytochrome c-type biogenesis protein [Burkholderiaceae bacterium]|nr:cytochrome c-type biogenesis protein [Burkholderiaceae bacterium]